MWGYYQKITSEQHTHSKSTSGQKTDVSKIFTLIHGRCNHMHELLLVAIVHGMLLLNGLLTLESINTEYPRN